MYGVLENVMERVPVLIHRDQSAIYLFEVAHWEMQIRNKEVKVTITIPISYREITARTSLLRSDVLKRIVCPCSLVEFSVEAPMVELNTILESQ
jgi:hypothetical protein